MCLAFMSVFPGIRLDMSKSTYVEFWVICCMVIFSSVPFLKVFNFWDLFDKLLRLMCISSFKSNQSYKSVIQDVYHEIQTNEQLHGEVITCTTFQVRIH